VRVQEALKVSEQSYRELANAMPQLVWTCDAKGNTTYYNKRSVEYDPPVLMEQEWTKLFHPDDKQASLAAWTKANAEKSAYVVEHRLRMANGTYAWHLSRAAPAINPAGDVIQWYWTSTDISESKEREAHIRVLMAEVNHRAKNLLAVSLSIARQTASSSKTLAEFTADFSARLNGLSASQDLLIRQNWNGAPLYGLVHSQLGHYRDLIGSRITLSGPDLTLDPAAAQALGMALHELSTNAAKYGALSVPAGKIAIQWNVEANGTSPDFAIRWQEHCGPPVKQPKQFGFGQLVMDKMLTQRLNGHVDLEYLPAGVMWCFKTKKDDLVYRGAQVLNIDSERGKYFSNLI
jgi:PAS domain S-box-containing protein